MSYTKTKETDKANCTKDYIAAIPKNVWDLLIPVDPAEHEKFCSTIHKFRIHEVGRDYVMDLQRIYRVPIRPNESVKATMIRVRLKILKQRFTQYETGNRKSLFEELPTDPLE